jgi:uncharacterized protein YjiS (DUF1127 family)
MIEFVDHPPAESMLNLRRAYKLWHAEMRHRPQIERLRDAEAYEVRARLADNGGALTNLGYGGVLFGTSDRFALVSAEEASHLPCRYPELTSNYSIHNQLISAVPGNDSIDHAIKNSEPGSGSSSDQHRAVRIAVTHRLSADLRQCKTSEDCSSP